MQSMDNVAVFFTVILALIGFRTVYSYHHGINKQTIVTINSKFDGTISLTISSFAWSWFILYHLLSGSLYLSATFTIAGILLNRLIIMPKLFRKLIFMPNALTLGDIFAYYFGVNGKLLCGIITTLSIVTLLHAQISLLLYWVDQYQILSKFSLITIFGIMIAYHMFRGFEAVKEIGYYLLLTFVISLVTLLWYIVPEIGSLNLPLETIFNLEQQYFSSKLSILQYTNILLVFSLLSIDPLSMHRLLNMQRLRSLLPIYLSGFFYISISVIIIATYYIISLQSVPGESLFKIINQVIGNEFYIYLLNIGLVAGILMSIDALLELVVTNFTFDILSPLSSRSLPFRSYHALKLSTLFFVCLLGTLSFAWINQDIYIFMLKVSILCGAIITLFLFFPIISNFYILFFMLLCGITAQLICDILLNTIGSFDNVWMSLSIILIIITLQYWNSYLFDDKAKPHESIQPDFADLSHLEFIEKINILFSYSILKRLLNFSSNRVRIHGAHYSAFGVFGTITYILPYFMWSHQTSNEFVMLVLRMMASLMCFVLIFVGQNNNKEHKIQDKFLPLYWHATLLFCLPFMSTYTILVSGFATTWVANSTLSIFILALLVDWISFMIIMPLGTFLGGVIYLITSHSPNVVFDQNNIYLMIYLNSFGLAIGGFFLHQKEVIINKLIEAKNNLEYLNHNLEEKVNIRTAHLKEALNMKTEFLNNISHEVRTPIQGITGIAKELVLQWEKIKDNDRYNYAKLMANNSDRLISLVSNLLDLSKFDAGKMIFDMSKCNLALLVNHVIEEQKIFNQKHNIKLNFANQLPKNINIIIDEERILQVIRNLINNAQKFTEQGEINIEINLVNIESWNNDANYGIQVQVKDTGCGIPKTELHNIFQPFVQSSQTKTKAGGTGLGLAISSEIIHAHKGKIWAENNSSQGSSFFFILPCNIKEEVADLEFEQQKNIIEKKSSILYDPSQIKVLVVDDEDPCLLSADLILQSSGFQVRLARGGIEALEILKQEHCDLILLDLMMPDMYGLEVLQRIKTDYPNKEIGIIIQSGTSDNQEISKALSMGAFAFVSKPFDSVKIIKVIKRYFSQI